jgi:hypothetical protein
LISEGSCVALWQFRDQKNFYKAAMNLSTFIFENMEAILQEWEDFAKKITIHSTHVMGTTELRDHAK